MRELENQPETNLLPEEVEEKFSQLMVRRREGGREGGGGREEGRGRHNPITCTCLPTLCFFCLTHSPISHTLPLHTHLPTCPPHLTPTLPTHTPLPQDFIIDLETFESQKAELIGQLESTLHPLTQFPQESATQLRRTTEQLKQGYETVTEKVRHPSHLPTLTPSHPHIFPPSHSHHPHTLILTLTILTMTILTPSPP